MVSRDAESRSGPAPDGQVRIEPSNWRDLNALRELERICFPLDAWPLLDRVGVLTRPAVVRLKAVVNGKMVGFVAGDVRRSQKLTLIATIGVLPEYRGRGIGSTLLRECEEQAGMPIVRLNVRISNRVAIHMYERMGYQVVSRWPRYYQDGEDALVMEKHRYNNVYGD